MANKSILDVDVNASSGNDDAFFINSNQSLKQIKKNNIRFDYDTHIENKPAINGVELRGGEIKLSELGVASKDEVSKKADEIIHTAKGERIAVGDSAGAFFEGLKLYGKTEQVQTKGYQLFDASKIATKSAGGATVTNNGDGSFTISGSGNLTGDFVNSHVLSNEEAKKLFKAGRVTLKGDKTYPFVYMQIKNTAGLIKELKTLDVDSERYLDLTSEHINSEGFHVSFGIYGSSGSAIIPGTVKPMVYQDGDGTWEPYTGGKPSPSMEYKQDPESSGDGGELEVKVKNSNLLGGEELAKKIVESGGTRSGNLVSFMCEKSQNSILFSDFEDNAEYTLILYGMCKNIQYSATNLSVTYNDSLSGGSVGQFTKKGEFSYCVHKIRSGAKRLLIVWDSAGTDIDITKSGLFKGQVDLSDFIESNTQTFSLQTSNGLPGLPIDSGGNYTDSNGQQWVCDEMDFGRGKYVQRIKKLTLDGSEAWLDQKDSAGQHQFFLDLKDALYPYNASDFDKSFLCNHFKSVSKVGDIDDGTVRTGVYKETFAPVFKPHGAINEISKFKSWLSENPTTILYILATPIETDIPEETMTAYRKLYTNSPTTVIQNGDNAYMEVDYATYTCRANKEDVKDLVDRIEDLQSYVGYYTDNHVVGLQVDYKNKTFKRLAGAKYLKPGADFDKYKMFGGRRKCIVEDSGKIVAWHGDKNYTEDGSLGQVMVYQPAFYYRVQPLELDPIDTGIGHHLRKANYYVSDIPSPGFKRHPAFYDANGNEIDYFLTSAYEGSIWDADGGTGGAYLTKDEQVMNLATDKFCSIAGVKPASGLTQNLTRPNIETLAQNRGANWHGDLIKQVSAEQMLMIIEMGMMNLQTAIAQGVVTLPWETGSDKTSSYAAVTGSTSGIGNGTGRAERTTTYEGGVAKEYTVDGKTSVCWRGKENFWGNIWKFVYGINIWGNGKMGGGQPYICSDFNFAENKNSGNYEGAGFTATNVAGYISAMGYSTICDWLFIASECTGNSSLPVGDYTNITQNLNGYRIARLGGDWNGGSAAGAFYWYLYHGVGYRARTVGGRLVYIPTRDSEPYKSNLASWRQEVSK